MIRTIETDIITGVTTVKDIDSPAPIYKEFKQPRDLAKEIDEIKVRVGMI